MGAVIEFASADGNRRLVVEPLSNGLFRFTELTFTDGDEYVEPYWIETYISGLYATLEEAEADARSTLPWLRDQILN